MSHYEELIKVLKLAAFDVGIPELAKRSGVSDDTIRRMLGKAPPNYMTSLQALEKAAAEAMAEKNGTPAP